MFMTRSMQDFMPIFRSALVILLLAGATSQLSAADDVSGEWELQMERNGLTTYATLTIARAADGKLTGKWGTNDLADVKFEGQKLTFGRTLRLGDQEFTMNYEGTLKDGALTGTLSSERGNFPANGARPRARHSALGRWELKYTIGDRDIVAVLAVVQKADGSLDATWTNTAAEHVVSDVKLEGQKLTLARKSKVQDREFESTYEATIDGHKLTGTIKSPLGEVPANGTRIGADLIGKWELATSSERGPRTSVLTVFGDLTGRYELFGSEIPFRDLKLDGGQVSFSLEVGFGDQTFTLDFKGKLEGSTLKGQVITPRGTREATGKRVEAAPSAKPRTTTL